MSNKPSNQPSGQRPGGRSQPLSLSQIGGDEALLLPIAPSSSVDEIIQLVRNSGASRVELLVPNDTAALQSIAGNETLREAAKAAGIHVTIFTSDEKTTHAARFAKLDVIGVGGAVAAPGPGTRPRRPTGQLRAVQSPAPPPTPRTAEPAPRRPAQTPPAPRPQPAPQPPTPAPATAEPDFFSQLEAFDQSPPRGQQSPGGAVLYDAPGDLGVQRPANNDDEWETAFGALDDTMASEAPADLPPSPRTARRARREEPPVERLERPTLLGAMLGRLPGRQRRAPVAEPADDGMTRMSRPDRTPEEAAARRRQGRNLVLWPLVAILGLVAVAALGYYALNGDFNLGGRPTVTITPPLNSTEAVELPEQIVPLVTEPVTSDTSINVQGQLVTSDESRAVQGNVSQTVLAPIGFARGTITLRNRSSQPVTIAAETPVSAGGQQFVIESDVTVPAATATDVGITFGVAEASLVAQTPGGQGNIPVGTISQIPGLGGTIAVAQNAPFSGGTDQEVRLVSIDDVNRVLPDAVSQLYEQGVRNLTQKVQQIPGFEIVASADTAPITPTRETLRGSLSEDQIQVFPPIGQVSEDGTFTVQVSQTFAALAAPRDISIDQQIQRAVTAQVRQARPDLQNATIEIRGWRRVDNGNGQQLAVNAVAVPPGGYQQLSEEFRADIAQNLAGKTREEAQAYLDSLQAENRISAFTLPEDIAEPIPENVEIQPITPAANSQ